MTILEGLFVVIFWTWVLTGALFLRNTFLPRLPLGDSAASWQLPLEVVRFRATDGLWLSGWKLPVDPQRPWVILCHGLGTNRADLLDIAVGLSRARFNLFLFDFRAHGESQGRSTSFGWLEQRDLEGALAFLGQQPDIPARPYGVFGVSMGGVVSVLVAARDERLKAVAIDSIYSNLEDSIARHLVLMYRLPRVPFVGFVSSVYRLRFGVWPREASPIDAVDQISPRAILVIHGELDERMPVDSARALFERAGEPKSLWVIPGARHLEGPALASDSYFQKLAQFFEENLVKQ